MTRHADPTTPDPKRPDNPLTDRGDFGEWADTVECEAGRDAPQPLAEAEHEILADDDLDDDETDDLDDEDDADPDEDDEAGEGEGEDEDDDFDDDDEDDDEDDEAAEDEGEPK